MKRLHVLALTCVLTGTAFVSPFAAAHAVMKGSLPAAGTTVEAPVKEIQLTFNEKVEESFSSVTVKDSGGKDVSTNKVHISAAKPTTLLLDVPALTSGLYSVQWVAVGHDGHRRNGDFTFTVK